MATRATRRLKICVAVPQNRVLETVNADWSTIKALCERTLAKQQWLTDSPGIGVPASV
jgi:hypothetical protein